MITRESRISHLHVRNTTLYTFYNSLDSVSRYVDEIDDGKCRIDRWITIVLLTRQLISDKTTLEPYYTKVFHGVLLHRE